VTKRSLSFRQKDNTDRDILSRKNLNSSTGTKLVPSAWRSRKSETGMAAKLSWSSFLLLSYESRCATRGSCKPKGSGVPASGSLASCESRDWLRVGLVIERLPPEVTPQPKWPLTAWIATLRRPIPMRSGLGISPPSGRDVGWLYLAAVLDLYSRRVVGWAMAASQDETDAARWRCAWPCSSADRRLGYCITRTADANTPVMPIKHCSPR
jgi:hypothetical protein